MIRLRLLEMPTERRPPALQHRRSPNHRHLRYTLAIYWQTLFAMNASPGFDPTGLLVFEVNEGIITPERPTGIVTALSQQPSIAGVAVSSDAVGRNINASS